MRPQPSGSRVGSPWAVHYNLNLRWNGPSETLHIYQFTRPERAESWSTCRTTVGLPTAALRTTLVDPREDVDSG